MVEMGSQDGGDDMPARAAAPAMARTRNTAGWDTLCQAAAWGQVKDAAAAISSSRAGDETTSAPPGAVLPGVTPQALSGVVDGSPARGPVAAAVVSPVIVSPVVAAAPIAEAPVSEARDFGLPPVVHHSMFEAFDALTQLEGAGPSVASSSAAPVVAASASAPASPPEAGEGRSSMGVASFYAWVETEGGLSAAAPVEPAPVPVLAPVFAPVVSAESGPEPVLVVAPTVAPELVARPEPAPVFQAVPEPVVQSFVVAELTPVLAPVFVSVMVESAPVPAPAPVVAETPKPEASPVEGGVAPPHGEVPVDRVAETREPDVTASVPVPASSRDWSQTTVDAAAMEALAAEMVPMAARPTLVAGSAVPTVAPTAVAAVGQPKPLVQLKAQATPQLKPRPKPLAKAAVPSFLSAVIGVADRALSGVGFGVSKAIKQVQTVKPVQQGKPVQQVKQVKQAGPATPPPVVKPVRAKGAPRGLIGSVEREVGIALGALKSAGSGLVRQAQRVMGAASAKPAIKKRPTQKARG